MPEDSANDPVSGATPEPGVDELAAGVADVLRAAMGVGTAMARTVARTTGAVAAAAPQGEQGAQLTALVQSTLDAAGGVARVIVRGLGVAARAAAAEARPDAAASAERWPAGGNGATPAEEPPPVPTAPEVHAGSTLRVPLSVENPADSPLDLAMACTGAARLDGGGGATGVPELAAAVRFEPASLSVAPRDFEKLTVYIDVPAGVAAGPHRVAIADADGSFTATLDVRVLAGNPPAEAPPDAPPI